MNIDIRTLVMVLALVYFLESFAQIFLYTNNKSIAGLRYWVWGSLCMAFGFLLLLVRDIPAIGVASIISANSLLLAGQYFLFLGVSRFLDGKPDTRMFKAFPAVLLSVFTINGAIMLIPHSWLRVVIMSVLLALIAFLTCHRLFIPKKARNLPSTVFTLVAFVLWGCFLTVRAVLALGVHIDISLFTPDLLQTAAFLVPLATSLLWTFGFILMVNQRLNAEKDELIRIQARQVVMGELIEFIAHQLKQGLYVISLYSHSMREKTATEHSKVSAGTLDALDGSIQSMMDTVSRFRLFLAPDSESMHFGPALAVDTALAILHDMLVSHGIRIEREVEDGLFIEGNPCELEQVLINIIINAKEAIAVQGAGSGIIRILVEGNASTVRFRIADNGGGLATSIVPSLFSKFATNKADGSGLGLYLSRMIVEHRFMGSISACNGNEGAVFTIEIPRSD